MHKHYVEYLWNLQSCLTTSWSIYHIIKTDVKKKSILCWHVWAIGCHYCDYFGENRQCYYETHTRQVHRNSSMSHQRHHVETADVKPVFRAVSHAMQKHNRCLLTTGVYGASIPIEQLQLWCALKKYGKYHQISNICCTQSPNINVVFAQSIETWGVKLRMKM